MVVTGGCRVVKKNEAFVDVIESVNLSISAKGNASQPFFFSRSLPPLIQARSFTLMLTIISKCEHTFLAPPECNANLVSKTNSSSTKMTKVQLTMQFWIIRLSIPSMREVEWFWCYKTIGFYTSWWGFWIDEVGLSYGRFLIWFWIIFLLLNRYRSTSNVKLPIRIIPRVTEVGTTRSTMHDNCQNDL